MRHLFVISFILLACTVSGQVSQDTCFTKTRFNEFKQKIYQPNDLNEIRFRKILLLTTLKAVDTILQSKDSMILNYISNTNFVLKNEKQVFRHGCMTDSVVTHFSPKGQTAYSEWWTITCNNPETIDNESVIFKYKSSYYRYEYDKEGRITKHVIHLSTPYTRRILYSYDSKGNKTQSVTSINDYDFWD